MSRTFTPREILLLFGFAGGLAVVDAVSRGSSSCVQCEVDLMQRSIEQRESASQKPGESLLDRETAILSR